MTGVNTTVNKWQWLPMALTFGRIAVAPALVVILMTNWYWAGWTCAILFILASITDWLDGFLARKLNAQSVMGQLMDPIADKILVLAAIVMLLAMGRVDPVMVFLFLGRDIFIGGLRAVAAAKNQIIAAKAFGKWKTGFQMVAIPCLLVNEPIFGLPIPQLAYYLLWLSVMLSMISGFEYTREYYRGR